MAINNEIAQVVSSQPMKFFFLYKTFPRIELLTIQCQIRILYFRQKLTPFLHSEVHTCTLMNVVLIQCMVWHTRAEFSALAPSLVVRCGTPQKHTLHFQTLVPAHVSFPLLYYPRQLPACASVFFINLLPYISSSSPASSSSSKATMATTTSQPQPTKTHLRRMHREALLVDFFSPPVQSTRYRVEKVIGEGAYGVVVSAIDTTNGQRVAVKRIKKVLHSDAMATRILRELKFLRLLNSHDNIISVKDVLIPSQRDKFNDVFVVMELMPTDLGRLLRSKTMLEESHVKLLMFQLISGVNFLHQAHVFHRDLNPANILVNTDCQLRICDFGLARVEFQRSDDLVFWTDYVATRWYRAPELILGQLTQYSTAIDMWSVGCIFAEMLNRGKPLFPGRNAHDQLTLILNVTGKPSQSVINRIGDRRLAEYLDTLPNVQPIDLSNVFSNGGIVSSDDSAINLLKRLLAFDPEERITASDALSLPYFDEFKHLGLGSVTEPLDERQFAFERTRLSAQQMRIEFLKEICEYHPEAQQQISDINSTSIANLINNNSNNSNTTNNNMSNVTDGALSSIQNNSSNNGGERRRHGHYLVPSQADQFRQDMEQTERLPHARKNRTLSSDVFAEINPDDPTRQEEMDYKNITLGEAELSRIGGAPTHHASSFHTHPSVKPDAATDSRAMEE